MANEFIITLADGTTLALIPEGTVDLTSTSLALHGRGKANYGQQRDQNLVSMLENFANNRPPANPLFGQLWFQKRLLAGSPQGSDDFFVWSGSPVGWRNFGGGTTPSTTPPPNPTLGDLWYDTDVSDDPWLEAQLKIYQNGPGSPTGGSPEWVSVALNYLPLTGGALTGDLDLGGNNFDTQGGNIDSTGGDIDSGGGNITTFPTGDITVGISAIVLDASARSIETNSGGSGSILGDIRANHFRADGSGTSSVRPHFGFRGSPGGITGMNLAAGGVSGLSFLVNGVEALAIQPQDSPLRAIDSTSDGASYEANVVNGYDIPNKAYVDTAVAGVAFDTSTVPVLFSQNANPGGSAKNGDIWMDTNDVPTTYIKVSGTFRQIFPAVYS